MYEHKFTNREEAGKLLEHNGFTLETTGFVLPSEIPPDYPFLWKETGALYPLAYVTRDGELCVAFKADEKAGTAEYVSKLRRVLGSAATASGPSE
ncbi:MAG: hypothetical protein HY518_01215 [Candidatus Aenigmarchaeota archaeon]|nr:hypothetical protein [Candidatus Aenigmarchaeota archaeon]